MKSVNFDHRNLTGPYCVYPPILSSDSGTTRAITYAMLVAVIAMIIALYAAMFLGLYRWSHYDPLLAPDSATIVLSDTH